MKKCKSCQTKIDDKAKKCPHCRADQRGFFRRHPIITTLLVLIVLGTFVSVSGGSNSSNVSTGAPDSTTQANSGTQGGEQKDATPKVGDIAKLGEREFIVNSVRRSGAFGYNTPTAGKEYVIVNVTIRNLGADEITYNPFDFKVQDANGAQESYTITSIDDQLKSGTLAGGGKVTGSIPFEVATGDNATLIFQPSFWSSQRVVVDLGDK
jgi:hypothetical protein